MTTKRCFKCQCEKPLGAFYKHAMMGDGHLNKCKDCTKTDVKKHRQDNLERIRSYDRMRSSMPHRISSQVFRTKEYRTKFPERAKANALVGAAVRDGKLKKQPCWVCGGKAIAHHPDYSRPLDVVWLCQPHHKQTHAIVANEPDMKDAA